MNNIIIYDNPKYLDRYTVIIDGKHCFGMSSNATGFNMYIGDLGTHVFLGKHLGKKLNSIPKGIHRAIEERIAQ